MDRRLLQLLLIHFWGGALASSSGKTPPAQPAPACPHEALARATCERLGLAPNEYCGKRGDTPVASSDFLNCVLNMAAFTKSFHLDPNSPLEKMAAACTDAYEAPSFVATMEVLLQKGWSMSSSMESLLRHLQREYYCQKEYIRAGQRQFEEPAPCTIAQRIPNEPLHVRDRSIEYADDKPMTSAVRSMTLGNLVSFAYPTSFWEKYGRAGLFADDNSIFQVTDEMMALPAGYFDSTLEIYDKWATSRGPDDVRRCLVITVWKIDEFTKFYNHYRGIVGQPSKTSTGRQKSEIVRAPVKKEDASQSVKAPADTRLTNGKEAPAPPVSGDLEDIEHEGDRVSVSNTCKAATNVAQAAEAHRLATDSRSLTNLQLLAKVNASSDKTAKTEQLEKMLKEKSNISWSDERLLANLHESNKWKATPGESSASLTDLQFLAKLNSSLSGTTETRAIEMKLKSAIRLSVYEQSTLNRLRKKAEEEQKTKGLNRFTDLPLLAEINSSNKRTTLTETIERKLKSEFSLSEFEQGELEKLRSEAKAAKAIQDAIAQAEPGYITTRTSTSDPGPARPPSQNTSMFQTSTADLEMMAKVNASERRSEATVELERKLKNNLSLTWAERMLKNNLQVEAAEALARSDQKMRDYFKKSTETVFNPAAEPILKVDPSEISKMPISEEDLHRLFTFVAKLSVWNYKYFGKLLDRLAAENALSIEIIVAGIETMAPSLFSAKHPLRIDEVARGLLDCRNNKEKPADCAVAAVEKVNTAASSAAND